MYFPRTFRFTVLLLATILNISSVLTAQNIKVQIFSQGALFTEGKNSVLFYQATTKTLNGAYPRANYVHPFYGLDGEIITEDFPEDHPHHRGIFWAWHQLYVGDKRIGDGWECKDLTWEVISIKKQNGTKGAKAIEAQVLWKSPLWLNDTGAEKSLIIEHTRITVYPAETNFRIIDFKIELMAMEPNMKLGGSTDAKGYGGFSTRVKLGDSVIFMDEKGRVEADNLPVIAGGWMDIEVMKNNHKAGLTIVAHPDNPGYPNPWILREKRSMQNAVFPFPGAEPIPLLKDRPLVLKYHLIVHKGSLSRKKIQSLQQQFSAM